eukprot:CAMPEP_0170562018 /NCGR_PEP_ID=MMETSP0211-20121228/58295_1 /TAXON_ID=311385 /ORGANISM="Pseudokeronopsis sp., Strain OXSARD2" /LENGTH=42 /DNA_ID= /DNA_START= /DNA_END= /DNA_ORIENTATION=
MEHVNLFGVEIEKDAHDNTGNSNESVVKDLMDILEDSGMGDI